MHKANLEFLRDNDIDIEELEEKGLSSNFAYEDLNPIFYEYGFENKTVMKDVSIADIVGFSKYQIDGARTIIDGFKWCFDETGGEYKKRGLGMLKIDKDEIVEKLQKSFYKEPITVIETEGNKYNIYTNGMHRFIVLRLLYLSELVKAGENPERIEALRKKYTIPVDVTEINKNKTYSKFLIMRANKFELDPDKRISSIRSEYNQNRVKTDNVEVIYRNGSKKVLNEKELIDMARREAIDKKLFSKEINGKSWEVRNAYRTYGSFKQYVDEVLLNVDIESNGKKENDKDEI